jgi:hypothetical protein
MSGGPLRFLWRAMCASTARATRGRSHRPLNAVVGQIISSDSGVSCEHSHRPFIGGAVARSP